MRHKHGSCNYAHLALFHLPLGNRKGSHAKVCLLLALLGLSQIRGGDKLLMKEQNHLFFVVVCVLTRMLALLMMTTVLFLRLI